MHEKKDAGQLNGHSSAEEYDDYVSKYLLNERECGEFLKKYPVMTDLLIRKIGDYINYVNEIIYVFLTIFLYLLKCPQSLILSALRAFCFCGKPHISRSIFLYFRYQAWLKSW